MKSNIIGIPIFSNIKERNTFLLKSRSAFSNFKFYNDLEKLKQEFSDKDVIDFVLKNKELSLEEFTAELQTIIG